MNNDEKAIDYLEFEYGIKENQRHYSIIFKLEGMHNMTEFIKGEVLNFCPAQLILKSDEGLYIISPKNIVELRPVYQPKKLI